MKNIAIVFGIVFLLTGTFVSAEDRMLFHNKLSIKNRAMTKAVSHNGRVVYNYASVRKGKHLDRNIGNIVVTSSAREARKYKIYNYTEILNKRITSVDTPIVIGNVDIEGGAKNVLNIVEIKGDVKTRHSQPIWIGNVSVEGNVDKITTSVTIEGNVEAK